MKPRAGDLPYQRVVFPSLACWGTAAVGSPGAEPWNAAVVGSAWPVMVVSAVAAATGVAAATSAAGCWFWKGSKFWKDISASLKNDVTQLQYRYLQSTDPCQPNRKENYDLAMEV